MINARFKGSKLTFSQSLRAHAAAGVVLNISGEQLLEFAAAIEDANERAEELKAEALDLTSQCVALRRDARRHKRSAAILCGVGLIFWFWPLMWFYLA